MARSTFPSRNVKTDGLGALFEVKLSAAVARSTFVSQIVKKYLCFAALFEVQMSKNSHGIAVSQSISQLVN